LPLTVVVALAGCRPADDFRTYSQPKPKTAEAASQPTKAFYVDVAGGADRLLGVLIADPSPRGGFLSLKLSGPAAAVNDHAAAFRAVAESVRLTGDPAEPLRYDAPPTWKPGPAKQMRLATLTIPGTPLEVGVFPSFGGSLLENVNRWRGQVGAAPVTDADLPTAAPQLPTPQ
jgi:hypothetical protein